MKARSDYHAAFGRATKALRKESKQTQQQVADQMGVPATFVSDIERGVRNVSLSTMLNLADALGCTLSYLVSRAERS